ncbi:hypothetical protein Lalb_Chr15g0081361 [Lupinus albus]|uniref:Uncharacterized protein n=1 Tax=Lupinus albus TaxID=3870 RepID=A0A6A4P147_LUPAL|nr:hypothetical protein Lalb_Chr15g0081361 [Lupinus albus]
MELETFKVSSFSKIFSCFSESSQSKALIVVCENDVCYLTDRKKKKDKGKGSKYKTTLQGRK